MTAIPLPSVSPVPQHRHNHSRRPDTPIAGAPEPYERSSPGIAGTAETAQLSIALPIAVPTYSREESPSAGIGGIADTATGTAIVVATPPVIATAPAGLRLDRPGPAQRAEGRARAAVPKTRIPRSGARPEGQDEFSESAEGRESAGLGGQTTRAGRIHSPAVAAGVSGREAFLR